MNIVITLPQTLIKAILEGDKAVEVRSIIPRFFEPENDRVFVVTKGTKKVTMDFQVTQFEKVIDKDACYRKYGAKMGIPYVWWKEYTRYKKRIYLWHIGDVKKLIKPLLLDDDLGLTVAPQSFEYVQSAKYVKSK